MFVCVPSYIHVHVFIYFNFLCCYAFFLNFDLTYLLFFLTIITLCAPSITFWCCFFYLARTNVRRATAMPAVFGLASMREKLFYAPGLKCPLGASSNQMVHLSVRLSVCNSVPVTNKVQYLKFGWSYSNQTWTVSSSMGTSHFTDITCPWGWGRVKM